MKVSIRKTKTGSGATAVQVVRYEKRKLVVVRHIGSGHSTEEINALIESAQSWIERYTQQVSLFQNEPRRALSLATTKLMGTTHTYARGVLLLVARKIG